MSLYLLLGISRDARLDDIRRAYRRLARRLHPGINPGDREAAERFQQIVAAYETLSDPERRRRYDVEGEVPISEVASAFEFKGFDFSTADSPSQVSTFGELFGQTLLERQGMGAAAAAHGADLHVAASVSFEATIHGARCAISLARLERCAPCGGHGRCAAPESPCIHCEGRGHVRIARGHMVFTRSCAPCAGTGVVQYRVCEACGGEGVGVHSGVVSLLIPPGVGHGVELVFPGEGHAGRRAGPAGALHLQLSVEPHPLYRRVDDDVWIEVPVAVHEAALGARIDVPTPDGMMRLRIPPGTPSGHHFRFRDRGVPGPDGRRGCLVVVVRLVLPALLDERSRELMREFAARNPADVRETWLRRSPTDAGAATPLAVVLPSEE